MNMKVKKLLMMNSPLILDKPINKKSEDILDFDIFSRNIVNMLRTVPKNESFNFALCGEWGSGKTSIMNLSIDILEKESLYNIVRFNPWNVIKKENLVNEFFKQLKGVIYKETNDKKILIKLSNYYKILFESIPNTSFLTNLFKSLSLKFLRNNQTITTQKEEIVNYLKNEYSGRPILIVIDDLDRLTNDEICEVLKLIREIADFPNVLYYVLFERNQVVNAIEKELGINSGEEYLRKFFQIEWMVPVFEKEKIKKYLFSLLEQNELCQKKFNSDMIEYYDVIFDKCISEFAKNIRDIKLLFNSFQSRFYLLHRWVNLVDLLAVTCFELYKPNLLKFIMEKKMYLLQDNDFLDLKNFKKTTLDISEEKENFIKNLFYSYFEKEEFDSIETILFTLFPKFSKSCFKESDINNRTNSERNHHLCSSLFFNAYFLQKMDNDYVVEYGVVHEIVTKKTGKEVHSFFMLYANQFGFLENIFMELSQEIANELPMNRIEIILRELFFLGQNLYDNLLDNHYDINNLLNRILVLIGQIFNKFSQKENYNLMNKIISKNVGFLNKYKFIAFFLIRNEYFYKAPQKALPSDFHFKPEDLILIKDSVIQKLNENRTKVALFDNNFEDVVFTLYNENSQSDIEKYYKTDLNKTETMIHLCLFLYHNNTKDKEYESIESAFENEFSTILSVQNRFVEIVEYINKGDFKNLPEMQRMFFANYIHEMNVSYKLVLEQKLISEKKLILGNWKELEKLVTKD